MARSSIAAFTLVSLAAIGGAAAQSGATKQPYVVTVDYTAEHAKVEDLKALIMDVARATLAKEPGCQRFDVVQPANAPDHLFLFEVFDDAAAFQAHAESAHFKAFGIASGKLNATRTATPGTMLLSLHKP